MQFHFVCTYKEVTLRTCDLGKCDSQDEHFRPSWYHRRRSYSQINSKWL